MDSVPDLHVLDTGQFFPRYTYAVPAAGRLFRLNRMDNTTDPALADYPELALP